MSNDVQIFDPLHDPEWDARIGSHDQGSFFHTAAWARVLADSYGYRPLYHGTMSNGALTSLVPCMEVQSFLTGKRGVSLPFTDLCEPITDDEASFRAVLAGIIDRGKRSGWRYVELRPGARLPGDMPTSTVCYGHLLDLTPGPERLFSGLRDSTRRNIKRAQASGVQVTCGDPASGEILREFCRLNYLTRRDHGLPPQPDAFFRNIRNHVLARGLGRVVLASYRGSVIAGAVFFHFNGKAIYKYGASDRRYQNLRANNLVMWDAIRQYASEGLRSFHFGRTEPENTGLLQFKRGWGAGEHSVSYYRYDLQKNAYVTRTLGVAGAHTAYFRRMPMPLLKAAGAVLYRHMG